MKPVSETRYCETCDVTVTFENAKRHPNGLGGHVVTSWLREPRMSDDIQTVREAVEPWMTAHFGDGTKGTPTVRQVLAATKALDRIRAVVNAAREEHDICHGAPRLDAKCSVCSALASLTQETPAQEAWPYLCHSCGERIVTYPCPRCGATQEERTP